MHIERLAVPLPGSVFANSRCPGALGNPRYMFGTFDRADRVSADSIHALAEAILGIREDGRPVALTRHRRAEVAAVADSSAYMFGVHPEQPPSALSVRLPLSLWASELD